ncbi:NAD(P)-binding protein [Demequina sp. SYSU T00192]|uniref:NAD(P)-binding protein n=1 Tax=Demequina litoralis TaxID=3051660 RepID=A0ABT8G5H3_9MICO|nr:NAD(P)-binding protein [Demequina sp. SYSU T00192]MDN4474386.1 NAD(P)-binding protein [Demequina sp. SYSU T00192]
MTPEIDADYLVVGAGAAGLAFADALVDHSDATVALVDRRDAPGGHWRDAYPFVRLHQASTFYGVASTVLGGALQTAGPERGLQVRATGAQVLAYYERVLARLRGTGRVGFVGGVAHTGGGRLEAADGAPVARARPGTRLVDARYLSPVIPASTAPPFAVDPEAHVVPVGLLDEALDAPAIVVVGSGKTATDAIVHALGAGVAPDRLTWIRPRDPWMLDRAVVQPDPAIFHGMVAATWEAAASARSLADVFLRLEDAGVMMRIDPGVAPTMAKAPTLGRWELDLLRSVERVVRLGHVRAVTPGRIVLDRGEVDVPPGAVAVHCAADGLRRPPAVPVWVPDAITLQPVRAGFPCFGAALVGYVEATRTDDAARNALCAPTRYGDTLPDWAEMTVRGARSSASFLREPDIRAWADSVALNPARVPTGAASAALDDARERIARHGPAGMRRLAELAGLAA